VALSAWIELPLFQAQFSGLPDGVTSLPKREHRARRDSTRFKASTIIHLMKQSTHHAAEMARLVPSPASDTASRKLAATLDCQAVILAGGLGTRMRPITETIPKPMIPVLGKPFLEQQLEVLHSFGFRRALLLVAYLGEKIEQYFGDGSARRWELSYSYEPSPLGTGGALKNAEAKLEDEFVVLNGDTFLMIDYVAARRAFRETNADAFVVAYEKPGSAVAHALANRLPNNLAVAPDGRVTAYRKHDPKGLTHIDAGVLFLRKKVLKELPPARPCSLEQEVFPRLIEEGRMQAWITSEPFYDMGSPEGLRALEARLG
jgi:NDP-sugar pyrophosphorylase family protein